VIPASEWDEESALLEAKESAEGEVLAADGLRRVFREYP
jgi:hypothetical protein